MRVCYFGTYRESYSRNVILIEALRLANVKVVECHQHLWHGIEDRVTIASGGWARLKFIVRLISAYWHLLLKYRQVKEYDVMIVGYPGQLDVFLAWVLTRISRKPLVLDIFMSLYLIAQERGIVQAHPLTGWLLHSLESIAYRLPELLIQDTENYVSWLISEYKLDEQRFRLMPTGADDRLFAPIDTASVKKDIFRVLYYGSYIPNHGVPYIMESVRSLKDTRDIMFICVGDGPDKANAEKFAAVHNLPNVEFVSWLPQDELVAYIAGADICLGAFGETPQSLMTVQNKIFECMAMGKLVVSGDSKAASAIFVHKQHIYLVERSNPEAISKAILTLFGDAGLREHIASNGYVLFKTEYNLDAQGQRFKKHLEGLLLQ